MSRSAHGSIVVRLAWWECILDRTFASATSCTGTRLDRGPFADDTRQEIHQRLVLVLHGM